MSTPITTVSKIVVHKGEAFTVTRETLALPGGNQIEKDFVRHPGAVVLVPVLEDGVLVLIKQYRHAIGRELLEFPAGTLEEGENPLECARRELAEEAGYDSTNWTSLGFAFPAPGFCDEVHHCFLARDLTPFTRKGDEDEIIYPCTMTVPQIEQAIANDELVDTKSITAFVKAKSKGFI